MEFVCPVHFFVFDAQLPTVHSLFSDVFSVKKVSSLLTCTAAKYVLKESETISIQLLWHVNSAKFETAKDAQSSMDHKLATNVAYPLFFQITIAQVFFFDKIGACPRGSLLKFVDDNYFTCSPISQCSSLTQSGKAGQYGQCKNCGNKDFCFESCDDSSYNFFHNRSMCFCL